jgi:CBS domain-containing protein
MTAIVRDVMTKDVEVVAPAAGFKEIVGRLRQHRVSALPVVDAEGLPVGVVSEADLLLKVGRGSDERPRRRRAGDPDEAYKAAGVIAAQLMSTPAVTVTAEATLSEAARRMHQHGVKRLLVVDEEDRLTGIVCRADLLRIFVREDEEIRREVLDDLVGATLRLESAELDVIVREGVVWIKGEVDRKRDVDLLERLAARVDGVVSVRTELRYRFDDTHGR